MSFLDRIKGAGRAKPEADIPLPTSPFDDMALPDSERTVRLGQSTLAPGGRDGDGADSSIISEAAPSELAQEFSETRLPDQRRTREWTGAIVTNPNCSTVVLAMALAPLRLFDIQRVVVSTMQAVSGAGYPGVASPFPAPRTPFPAACEVVHAKSVPETSVLPELCTH